MSKVNSIYDPPLSTTVSDTISTPCILHSDNERVVAVIAINFNFRFKNVVITSLQTVASQYNTQYNQ